MRLNQVTVGATDFEASVRFYCDLGLRLIVSSRGEYARFEMPEGDATFSIHLQGDVPANGPDHLFQVEDVDAAAARLTAQGGTLESGPKTSFGCGGRRGCVIRLAISFVCFRSEATGFSRLADSRLDRDDIAFEPRRALPFR